jgi:hypothetical protein
MYSDRFGMLESAQYMYIFQDIRLIWEIDAFPSDRWDAIVGRGYDNSWHWSPIAYSSTIILLSARGEDREVRCHDT